MNKKVIGTMSVLVMILSFITCHAEPGVGTLESQLPAEYTLRGNVTVGYNYNLELLNIAAAHSADFNHRGYIWADGEFKRLVKEHFGQLKKKDYSADFYKQSSDEVIHKFIKGETKFVIAYDSQLDKMLLQSEGTGEFSDSGQLRNRYQLISALKDFKNYSQYDEFLKKNVRYFQDTQERFKKAANFDFIANIQELLGLNMDSASFNIILSPSESGGTAIKLKAPNGSPVYVITINPTGSPENILHLLYHEEIHNYLNPIFEKDRSKYDNGRFTNVLNSNAGNSNAFNETITRALEYIMLNRYHNIDTTKMMQGEILRGWANTDKVYELLKKEYVDNRGKYKSIEEFIPRVIEYLKELERMPQSAGIKPGKYGAAINKDTVVHFFGSKEYCAQSSLEFTGCKLGKKASLTFLDVSYFEDTNALILISAPANYSALHSKIKEVISEAEYKAIQKGSYRLIKVNNAKVIIDNLQ